MTDYSELIKALRETDSSDWKRLSLDAAAAIEELENALADECKECDYLVDENSRLTTENNKLQAEVNRLELDNEDYEHEQRRLKGEIEALQTEVERLQAQLPKLGEWELIDGAEPMRWGCSRCKYLSWETSNYCPRCGAKMEVQE